MNEKASRLVLRIISCQKKEKQKRIVHWNGFLSFSFSFISNPGMWSYTITNSQSDDSVYKLAVSLTKKEEEENVLITWKKTHPIFRLLCVCFSFWCLFDSPTIVLFPTATFLSLTSVSSSWNMPPPHLSFLKIILWCASSSYLLLSGGTFSEPF